MAIIIGDFVSVVVEMNHRKLTELKLFTFHETLLAKI